MSEYKVGQWYGWNGDECPVHPLSCVAAVVTDDKDTTIITRPAGEIRWFRDFADLDCNVIAFRVIEEYVMPREYFLEIRPDGSIYGIANGGADSTPILKHNKIIKVVEQR